MNTKKIRALLGSTIASKQTIYNDKVVGGRRFKIMDLTAAQADEVSTILCAAGMSTQVESVTHSPWIWSSDEPVDDITIINVTARWKEM